MSRLVIAITQPHFVYICLSVITFSIYFGYDPLDHQLSLELVFTFYVQIVDDSQ